MEMEEEEVGRRAREEEKAAVDGVRMRVTERRPAEEGWRRRRLANSMVEGVWPAPQVGRKASWCRSSMGRAVATSKSKRKSEEHRRKRKNPKSRKSRRVSFSPSSYSSDDDDVSRGRRRSRRKAEKRRGRDPKRSMKRKSRKARRRSVSSANSDSSSSCSTCRSRSSSSLNRSRSPARGGNDRRDKFKKKVKRGRKLDRVVRSLRSRSRSLSCSTCSGSSEQPSQTLGHKEAKNKERDGSRQIGSSSVVESPGEEEERYGIRGGEIGNEMIMVNYDDSQLPRANFGRNVDRVEEDRVMDEGSYEKGAEIDRWMNEGNVENDSYFDQFEDNGTQASEHYKEPGLNTKLSSRIRSEIVATDNHDSDSDDLELMLRQKALENLKKLRGGPSSDKRTTEDRKNEIAGVESSEKQCETAKKFISSPKSRLVVFNERRVQLGVPSHDSEVKPVIQPPSLEANFSTSDKKMLFSRLNQSSNSKQLESTNGQSTSNLLNNMEDSPEKMSDRQSPCRVSQEKNATEGCGSGNSLKSEVNLGDGKEKIPKNNETVDECQSGSQFEQKTFSRMHDGETVQVSYKVYIPKKTPALARRKLQR